MLFLETSKLFTEDAPISCHKGFFQFRLCHIFAYREKPPPLYASLHEHEIFPSSCKRYEVMLHAVGEKMKLELKKAKRRKSMAVPDSRSELEARKQRIALNKKLAPHFIGELGLPTSWLHKPLKGFANRDDPEDHMLMVANEMEACSCACLSGLALFNLQIRLGFEGKKILMMQLKIQRMFLL